MNAQTKIEHPPSIVAVLAQVLPTLGAVHKNKTNPAFRSNYADLKAVITALAPIAEHGLWFRQVPVQIDGGIGVETFYVHESGAELSAGITPVPVNKNDAQGLGSAFTYGRRYGLMAAFGLSADDDDGNAAAKAPPAAPAYVSDAQWAELVALVEATKTDAGKFCAAYGIDSIKALPAATFSKAKAQLQRKLAQLETVNG